MKSAHRIIGPLDEKSQLKQTIKKYTLLLMSALTVICLTSCASTESDLQQLLDEGCSMRVYEIFGMDCPGCHSALEDLLNDLPGARASRANWKKQQVTLVLQPGTDIDDNLVFEAIRRANFTPGKRLD